MILPLPPCLKCFIVKNQEMIWKGGDRDRVLALVFFIHIFWCFNARRPGLSKLYSSLLLRVEKSRLNLCTISTPIFLYKKSPLFVHWIQGMSKHEKNFFHFIKHEFTYLWNQSILCFEHEFNSAWMPSETVVCCISKEKEFTISLLFYN